MDRGAWRATVHGVAKSRASAAKQQKPPQPKLTMHFLVTLL